MDGKALMFIVILHIAMLTTAALYMIDVLIR